MRDALDFLRDLIAFLPKLAVCIVIWFGAMKLVSCNAQQRETTIKQLPAIVDLACSLVRAYPGSTAALERARDACARWDTRSADADEVLDAVKECEVVR